MRTPRSRTSAGLLGEVGVLLVAAAEQLEQHRAADVEPLGHRSCRGRRCRPSARGSGRRSAGRPSARRRSRIGNSARHSRVTCQLSASMATPTTTTLIMLRHRARERRGERPLGADHVVVEPGDQRTGLGAGEERQRHPLDVGEDPGAQVEDQALADAGGEPAHAERQRGVDARRRRRRSARASPRELVFCLRMPSSTMCLTSSGVTTTRRGVDDGEDEEAPDQPPVRPREADDAADRVAGELLVADAAVGAHVTPHRSHAGAHRHLLTSLSVRSLPHEGGEIAEPSNLCLALGQPLGVQVDARRRSAAAPSSR